jgi:hypothetical protein
MVLLLLACLLGRGLAGYAPATGPKLPEGWCGEKEGTLTRSTGECMCRYGCEGPGCHSGQGMIWYAYKDCKTGCRCSPRPGTPAAEAPSTSSQQGAPGFAATEEDAVQCSEDVPCDDVNDGDGDGTEGEEEQPYVDVDQKKKIAEEKWKAEVAARAAAAAEGGGSADDDDDDGDGDDWSEDDSSEYARGGVGGGGGGEEGEEDALGAIEGALEWADENWRIIFGLTVIIVLSCVLFPSLLAFGGTTVPSPRPPTGGAPAAAASAAATGNASAGAVAASKASKDADAKTKEQ